MRELEIDRTGCASASRVAHAAIGLALLVTLAPGSARAYRTTADLVDFGEGRVGWHITPQVLVLGDLPAELSGPDVDDAIRAAIGAWRKPKCMELDIEYGGSVAASSLQAIAIEWVDNWSERGNAETAPGTTDVQYVASGIGWEIASAAIYLNAHDFEWNTGNAASKGKVDVQAVVTHELGHALGLLHVCEPGGELGAPACATDLGFETSAMFPEYRGTSQRLLDGDDVAGMCFLYADTSDCRDADNPDECYACGAAGCDEAGTDEVPQSGAGLLGDPCTRDVQCASGICDRSDRCTQACSEANQCPAGFECAAELPGAPSLCQARGRSFAAGCDEANQCASALCLIDDARDGGMCTRRCDVDAGAGCPTGFQCAAFADRHVCTVPRDSDMDDSGGCSVAPAVGADAPAGLLTALMSFAALALLRRRRIEE